MAQMNKIKRNTLADGTYGRFFVRGSNGYRQSVIGDVRVSVDGRLTLFKGVTEWTYTAVLDKSSVPDSGYAKVTDADGKEISGYDPSAEVVVRLYWWAHMSGGMSGGKLKAGKCPLPEHMGARWMPREESRRLDQIIGRAPNDDQCPLPVWIKVSQKGEYNNVVEFGDESIKNKGKLAAAAAEQVEDDDETHVSTEDVIDDEPADDVPVIQQGGEAEHKPMGNTESQQSTRRRSRSS